MNKYIDIYKYICTYNRIILSKDYLYEKIYKAGYIYGKTYIQRGNLHKRA